jgi:hypothetical protein
MYVCVFVQVFWLPTATRDGDWQDCDTQRIGDGGDRGRVTQKNQFLPYVCDLFQYIEFFNSLERIQWKSKTTQLKDQDSEYQAITI